MSKEIECDVCKKNATVHLTQIINGKVHKVDLCEECAQNLGVTDPNGFSVADLLTKDLVDAEGKAGEAVVCEHCGCTKAQFKKTGRFGCSHCYEAFSDVLGPLLKKMHTGTDHIGKVPVLSIKRQERMEILSKLELDLHDAVKSENYEEAAKIRDHIADLSREATDSDDI